MGEEKWYNKNAVGLVIDVIESHASGLLVDENQLFWHKFMCDQCWLARATSVMRTTDREVGWNMALLKRKSPPPPLVLPPAPQASLAHPALASPTAPPPPPLTLEPTTLILVPIALTLAPAPAPAPAPPPQTPHTLAPSIGSRYSFASVQCHLDTLL